MQACCSVNAMLSTLGKYAFAGAYNLYVYTPLGAALHARIPCLSDNYAYLLVDRTTREAALVDPCDAQEALAAAEKIGVKVSKLLVTHHHVDHAGGNLELKKALPELTVVGGKDENVPGVTLEVGDREVLRVGETKVQVFETPFHTPHHVVFVVHNGEGGDTAAASNHTMEAIFSGDVLLPVLNKGIFAQLPGPALVFPGHEYTLSNMRFALWLLPEDKAVAARMEWAQDKRKSFLPTVPVSIEYERSTNPFLNIGRQDVRDAVFAHAAAKEAGTVDESSDAAVFMSLRSLKDGFTQPPTPADKSRL